MGSSTALLTDRYEWTRLDAAIRGGAHERTCQFEVFARSLPDRRRYGVVAGLGRLVAELPGLRFDVDALDFLSGRNVIDGATRDWLACSGVAKISPRRWVRPAIATKADTILGLSHWPVTCACLPPARPA